MVKVKKQNCCLLSDKEIYLLLQGVCVHVCVCDNKLNICSPCRLIEDGVNINCRHPLGWTPLHVAVINGNAE